MIEQLIQVIVGEFRGNHPVAHFVMLAVLCVLAALALSVRGIRNKGRAVAWVILVLYVLLVYLHTVVFRQVNEDVGHNFGLFWSYGPMRDGDMGLIIDSIVNVLMFMPIGFLLGGAFPRIKWRLVLLIGACMSLSIESLQYFCFRGFSEVDDILHNALGCLVGWLAYRAIIYCIKR